MLRQINASATDMKLELPLNTNNCLPYDVLESCFALHAIQNSVLQLVGVGVDQRRIVQVSGFGG